MRFRSRPERRFGVGERSNRRDDGHHRFHDRELDERGDRRWKLQLCRCDNGDDRRGRSPERQHQRRFRHRRRRHRRR
ncbi:hypothetical protein [Sorangium sp. So ce426]|uniref:hypothetical protein n=1 Tax=Sorangium sp. So ce426 TaxID=3133312 RepID=UPI003F5C4E1F